MHITVIVFCDPEHSNSVAQFLDCFLNQTLPHTAFDVIVADDGGRTDFREAIAAARERVPTLNLRYVPVNGVGRAAALNVGIRLAHSPLIAFVADDALIAPTALQAFVAYHSHNPDPLAVAIGPMLFAPALRADGLRRWLEDSGTQFGVSMRQHFTLWPHNFFFSGNTSIKAALFDKVGCFNEIFPWITWDDYEFGLRLVAAGGYTQLVNGALAWHDHYVTFAERVGAMRKGGHAAHIHEHLGARDRSWQRWIDSARRNRDQPLLPDNPALSLPERIPIFKAHFDRAFLSGYEAEARGDRGDLD